MVILFGIDVIPLALVNVVLVVLQGTVVGGWYFIAGSIVVVLPLLSFWSRTEKAHLLTAGLALALGTLAYTAGSGRVRQVLKTS